MHHNALLRGMGRPEVDADELHGSAGRSRRQNPALFSHGFGIILDQAKKRVATASCLRAHKGLMLDVDHGTYPFRHIVQHFLRPSRRRDRHGPRRNRLRPRHHQGLHDARWRRPLSQQSWKTKLGQRLGERGHEFGTVTGRKRRCGWFDAVMVRQAVKDRRHHRHRAHQSSTCSTALMS